MLQSSFFFLIGLAVLAPLANAERLKDAWWYSDARLVAEQEGEAKELHRSLESWRPDLGAHKTLPDHRALKRPTALVLNGDFHTCETCRGYLRQLAKLGRDEKTSIRFGLEGVAASTGIRGIEDPAIFLLDGILYVLRAKRGEGLEQMMLLVPPMLGREFEQLVLPTLRKEFPAPSEAIVAAVKEANAFKGNVRLLEAQGKKLPPFIAVLRERQEFVQYALAKLAVQLITDIESRMPDVKLPRTRKLLESNLNLSARGGEALHDLVGFVLRNRAIAQNALANYFAVGKEGRDYGVLIGIRHVADLLPLFEAAFQKARLPNPVYLLAGFATGEHVGPHRWPPGVEASTERHLKAQAKIDFIDDMPW